MEQNLESFGLRLKILLWKVWRKDGMVRESRVCTRVVTYQVNETIHTR